MLSIFQALIALLQGERFSQCSSIIIYCTRRQQTDRVATIIRTRLQNPADDINEDEETEDLKKIGEIFKCVYYRLLCIFFVASQV